MKVKITDGIFERVPQVETLGFPLDKPSELLFIQQPVG